MRRFLTILAVGVTMLVAQRVQAATVSVVSRSTNVAVGDVVTVEVRLASDPDIINAVDATVSFDPTALSAVDLSRGGSLLTFWAEAPRSDQAGHITFAGGLPEGTLVVDGKLLTMTFRALRSGSTTVQVVPDSTSVLLSDGHGTPASLATVDLTLTLGTPVPFTPDVRSPSHPNPAAWSTDRVFIVQWPADAHAVVSYSLSRDPVVEPDDVVEENSGRTSFAYLQDGVWYFALRERRSGEPWGPLARREVRIDGTLPEPFHLQFTSDPGTDGTLLTFGTSDRTSGLNRYVVRVVRSSFWQPWRTEVQEREANGVAEVRNLRTVRSIVVLAYDQAGNVRAVSWEASGFRSTGVLLVVLDLVGVTLFSFALLGLMRRRRRS